MALLFPSRSSKYDEYVTNLKYRYGFTYSSQPSEALFSIGYKIILN